MNKEYYANRLPYIEDARLEKVFMDWAISLDLSEVNARKLCEYITEIKTDALAPNRAIIESMHNLLHIIEHELPKSIRDKYIGDIHNAKMHLVDFHKT